MIINFRKIVVGLICFGFILTPVFGVQELLDSFPAFKGIMAAGPWLGIKMMKDVILFSAFIVFMLALFKQHKILSHRWLWLMMILLIISVFNTVSINPLLAVIGLRVFSPIALIYVSYRFFDFDVFKKFKNILMGICILEFILALIQRSFNLNYGGPSVFGMRIYGTFVAAGNFALFICCLVCLQMGTDLARDKKLNLGTYLFVLISIMFIFLTASGTGIIGILTICLVYFVAYFRMKSLAKMAIMPLLVVLPIIVMMALPTLTGRHKILNISGQTRINVFSDLLARSGPREILLGSGIGLGSNAMMNVATIVLPDAVGREQAFIADSFYSSIISQVGGVFLLCFILFVINIFVRAWRNKYQGINPTFILVIPLILVSSFAGAWIESFPINWLVFIICGIALKGTAGEMVANCSNKATAKV